MIIRGTLLTSKECLQSIGQQTWWISTKIKTLTKTKPTTGTLLLKKNNNSNSEKDIRLYLFAIIVYHVLSLSKSVTASIDIILIFKLTGTISIGCQLYCAGSVVFKCKNSTTTLHVHLLSFKPHPLNSFSFRVLWPTSKSRHSNSQSGSQAHRKHNYSNLDLFVLDQEQIGIQTPLQVIQRQSSLNFYHFLHFPVQIGFNTQEKGNSGNHTK